MITEDRAEKAVEYLRDTSEKYGMARGHAAFCSGNLRRVKAMLMLQEKEGSLGDREARAYASETYLKALEAEEDAIAEYEILRAKREAAQCTIDVWRSQASARKQGVDLS